MAALLSKQLVLRAPYQLLIRPASQVAASPTAVPTSVSLNLSFKALFLCNSKISEKVCKIVARS